MNITVSDNMPCQRWKPGAIQSWRRPEEGGFDGNRYGVEAIPDDTTAMTFVTGHHYSGTYVAARLRYGLYDLAEGRQDLVGVAVLSIPANKKVLSGVFPDLEPYQESLELGRFVLTDEVPANGETWFLAEVRRLAAKRGVRGIVSFSDPHQGHVGTIYQASNGTYTGPATPRTIKILRTGVVFNDRAAQKIRAGEQGHEYAERQLIKAGASPMRAGQLPRVWLRAALDEAVVRRVAHPGNFRYAFGRRGVRIALPSRPYPKPAWTLF